MKQLFSLLIVLMFIALTSCSTTRCYPSRFSKDWAVVMKEGTISKDYRKTTLINLIRTPRGFKHVFAEDGDTLIRYLKTKLEIGKCYWVRVS